MVTARRSIRRNFGRDHHPAYRALAKVFAAVVWPPAVLIHLLEFRYHFGPDWVPIKRAPGALWTALRHNVLPGEYYAYALWQPQRKVHIDDYLYAREGASLFKLLNRPSQPNPIDDKLAFHEMCKAHGVPSPEILAAFAPAGKLREFDTGLPPKHDLFVKPNIGLGGDGTERFRWQGTMFESNRGCHLNAEELSGYLATRARIEKRILLVQPVLFNHPALRAGRNTNLIAARLITALSTDGNVFPICGFIYFTQTDQLPGRYVSVSLIDIASGQLTRPQELFGAKRSNTQLDDSDFPCRLPDWKAAIQYAKVAHRACSNFAFIGWDIAFTIHGPVLLEGNTNWCADEYQRLRGEPLGNTKFAEILAEWIRNLN